jgi:two-component system chemotaxis sensor kinase CheA
VENIIVDKAKLIQRLMRTFLEELDEHVRAFNRDLLALEKNPTEAMRAECLKNLFRTAHSLKGAARSVNVTLIESACHRLESILEKVRDGTLEPGPDLYQLLFCSVDGIEEAGMRLREQHDLADAPLAALLPRLDAFSVSGDKAKKPPAAAAAESPPQEPPVPDAGPASPPPTPAKGPEVLAAEPVTVIDASSVRVSAEKLDTLLGRIGELLVAKRRVQSRVVELALLDEFVEHWEREWRGLEKLIDGICGEEGAAPARRPEISRRAALVLRNNGTRLRRLKRDLDRLAAAMKSDSRALDQAVTPLDDEVHAVRMLPFAETCAGLDRTVRDLAHAGGKEVELIVAGGKVELDRSILEGLKDPLRHLVRNAVDHGIELPAARQQAGKNPCGRIVVTAALRGSQVEVAVQDDGRGLNLDALRELARRRRIGGETAVLTEQELVNLIFLPGLSTASIITDVSGRGVGLDVVKSRVEALHGTVTVSSVPGQGVCFTLTVPLTLTMLRAVLVNAGGQTFAFAGTNVHKFVLIDPREFRTVAGREMLILGGQPIPFAHLSAVLQTGTAPGPPSAANDKMPVLVVAAGEKRVAFGVDEFLAEQEILVKSLGPRIRQVPMVAGATLLASGKIALVLNGANLVRAALGRSFAPPTVRSAEPAATVRKRLLVAEDSITTRTLEKSILEGAGYDVATAVDGQAAWEYLKDHDVDLIVSDVEMPNMDGFELAEAVRASQKLRSTPLILVSARETDQDKAHGIAVGADAYLVKSAFDQRNLLETIAQLL